MEIDAQHTTSPHRAGPPIGDSLSGRAAAHSGAARGGASPAFIIDLAPRALQAESEGDDAGEPAAGPGKSAESPAHRARALIAQFSALSETQDSPFKAFGHVVSQLAQGKTLEEIFSGSAAASEANDDAAPAESGSDPLATIVGEEDDSTLVT